MNRHISALTAIGIFVSFVLLLPAWAQSEKQGIGILKEANELRTKAHSRQDLEKALEKYQQALRIFEKNRSEKWKGATLNRSGHVYLAWGEYQKALENYEKALAITRKIGDVDGEGGNLKCIGDVYLAWGQYQKALENYEKALAVTRKVGNAGGEGNTLNSIGHVYLAWGQYQKALENYEKALAIMRKVGNAGGEGNTLNSIGHVYLAWGQYQKALENYEKALAIMRKVGNAGGEGNTLISIGHVYRSWGQYQKALEYYEKSLAIRQKIGAVRGKGDCLNAMGQVYSSWGQYDKALQYYEKALAIEKKLGNLQGEGVTLISIGHVYRSWGQYQKALEYYEKSLAIRQKIGDVRGKGDCLNAMGQVYSSWGQYDKALQYYEEALVIEKKLGNLQGEGVTLNRSGHVYRHSGQYQKALEHYEKALAITRKTGDFDGEGGNLKCIGDVYLAWGQYQKALENYEQALAVTQKLGNADGEGATLNSIGHVYLAWGQHQKALEHYQAALAIGTRIGLPIEGTKDLIANVYLDVGELAKAEPFIKEAASDPSQGRLSLLKGDHQAAVDHYVKALARAHKTRNVDSLFASYTGLALGYEGLRKYEDAADNFQRAIDLTEQMRDELNEAQRANFYDVTIGGFPRIAPYEGLCRALIHQGRPHNSFKLAEGTRARIFAELLSSRAQDTSFDVPKTVVDQDADMTNRLAAMVQGLNKAYEKESQDAIQSFEKQVKKLREERDAHISKLRKEYPLFAATKYPQPMDLRDSALKDNEWVLEYEVTDSGVAIYLVKGTQVVKALFEPVPRKELDGLVRKFREPLEVVPGKDNIVEKLKAFDFTSGKKLADLLLKEVLAELPAGTPVIIVPDDSLGVLPFEMLVLKTGEIKTDRKIPYASGAEFFGDRNPVSYYQSLTALTLARTLGKEGRSGDKLLVMADPVYQMKDQRAQKASSTKVASGNERFYSDLMVAMEESTGGGIRFDRLPLTGDLAEGLESLFSGKTDLYTGFDANKELFLRKISPELGQYRSIVFATHGYFGTRIPGILEPILILSTVPHGTDGFLRMSEVMGLRMHADVVALTACQSGLGRTVSGEGTMGMGRAFQYAGAKSVLMTLWSVSEKSSVKLVESFFSHLNEGKGKLEAMKLARDEIRKDGFDHPFFWAPFIIVGEVQ